MAELAIAALAGFVAGSIPFAVLVAKMMGLPDPRGYGSGNPGATNVMRSGNKWAGRLVFLLDFAKGLAPAVACEIYLDAEGMGSVAGFAAVAGHCWNPWLGLKGGKGVATGFGALLGIDWRVFMFAVAAWAALFLAWRTVSVASVASVIAAMLFSQWLYEYGSYPAVCTAGMAMIIVIRHRRNMADLLAGKERKFGGRDADGSGEIESAPRASQGSARQEDKDDNRPGDG